MTMAGEREVQRSIPKKLLHSLGCWYVVSRAKEDGAWPHP